MALLYNQLLSVGHVPCEWLAARTVPVHRKGITLMSQNIAQLCLFKVKLFADDVKMYIRILDDLYVRRLQLAFDALV